MVKIRNPPLKTFSIEFNFNKMNNKTFAEHSKLEELIDSVFDIKPQISLLQRRTSSFDLPVQINPIIYKSKDGASLIHIYSDSIIFLLNKYNDWTSSKMESLEILTKFNDVFSINSINRIQMDYINQFKLPKKEFTIKNYFNLFYQFPNSWKINYNDFTMGIDLDSDSRDEGEKLILRLRGIPTKNVDNHLIQLETILMKNIDIELLSNYGNLEKELDLAHDDLEKKFIDILTQETKLIIGMEN